MTRDTHTWLLFILPASSALLALTGKMPEFCVWVLV